MTFVSYSSTVVADNEGKTALTHAIEGRAYMDTIRFLLDNGADIQINQLHHLKVAAQQGHAGVFHLLLTKQHTTVLDLIEITQFVINSGSYIINSVLLEKIKDHTIQSDDRLSQLKNRLISTIHQTLQTLTEDDVFELCKVNGGKAFGYYIDAMKQRPNYDLKEQVNRFDGHGKSPLYYAISNNAYDSLVHSLLACGADPNTIGYEENSQGLPQRPLSALILTIRAREPSTLQVLLESKKVSAASINDACEEMMKPEHNNALLITHFIQGLYASGSLNTLPLHAKQGLLHRSLCIKEEYASGCISRVCHSMSAHEWALHDVIIQAIETKDGDMLRAIMRYFYVKTSPYATELNTIDSLNEPNQDYLAFAISLAQEASTSEPQTAAMAKEIVNILLEYNVKTMLDEQDLSRQLAGLGISATHHASKPSSPSCILS